MQTLGQVVDNRRSAAINLWISDLLLLGGALLICAAGLFWLRGILSSRQLVDREYLFSSPAAAVAESLFSSETTVAGSEAPVAESKAPVAHEAEIPVVVEMEIPVATGPEAAAAEPEIPATAPEVPMAAEPGAPVVNELEILPAWAESAPGQMFLPLISSKPIEQVVAPAPAPVVTGPVVRLVIPSLQIDRAVVPISVRMSAGGIEWDTDKLFATRNRLDLVGQPEISTNPSEGGNVILVGHNYDNGIFIWEGVFVDIKSIQAEAEITLYTEGGGQFRYIVQQVKKVPWASKSAEELERHAKFLGPQPSERLTLVTCGGANIWPWPARIYVVAKPVQ